MSPLFFSILFSTFILEDVALVASLALVAQGKMSLPAAFLACFFGIGLGDILVYGFGRALRQFQNYFKILQSPWLLKKISKNNSLPFKTAVIISRFIPGTRVAVYLTAGFFRYSFLSFVILTLFSVFAWVVLAFIGGSALLPFFNQHWFLFVLGMLVFLHSVKSFILPLLNTWDRKAYFHSWRKWRHFEFWPPWLFYIPVLFYYFYLSLKHRSLFVPMDSNPRILHGGFIGESKWDFYQHLENDPSSLHPQLIEFSESRLETIEGLIQVGVFQFPFILKPDIGQRGFAVRIIKNHDELRKYLQEAPFDLIIQEFCPWENEAGLFYYKYPGLESGKIFSITTKKFPFVVGDGTSKLGDLILNDDRARIIAKTYFDRHRSHLDEIPEAGKKVRLSECGNHCQGAIFLNGQELLTDALLQSLNKTASRMPDFFIGRFDIRYESDEKLINGEGIKIIEVNGASSEATHIWDPQTRLLEAYQVLFQQWKIVFEIGQAVRDQGRTQSPLKKWTLFRDIFLLLFKKNNLSVSS